MLTSLDSRSWRSIFSLIVVLSGISGLGYQMAWSKMLSVALGHEILAVLAVVAAFFVGLALGAFVLNRRIANSQVPQRWYTLCELVIGLWSLALITLIPHFNQTIAIAIGAQPSPIWHWFVAFGGTLVLLLPSTFCMGATLPAIERVFSGILLRSQKVSGLYGLNTLGAVVGVLISTFWLVPQFGLAIALGIFAVLNLLCAAVVLLLWNQSVNQAEITRSENSSLPIVNQSGLMITLFVCGWLGLGYEVLSIRALSQILENTVYTFAAVLCIYLLGTAAGAACYQTFYVDRQRTDAIETATQWQSTRFVLLTATALACILGTFALWLGQPVYDMYKLTLGYGATAALIAELSVAFIVLFLPTFLMGMLFSHLIKGTVIKPGLGMGLGVNTLGSALAPLSFGIIFIPLVGTKIGLVLVSLSYLALIPLAGTKFTDIRKPNFKAAGWLVAPLTLCALIFFAPLPQGYISKDSANQQILFTEGVVAAVEVSRDSTGNKHLSVNNHYIMGGTASRFSDHRQTHIPFLLHGNPSSALYLGLGTGITMDAAKYYPNTQVTGVELVPELLPLLAEFGVETDSVEWHKKPQLISADARRFMLTTKQQFDVIIAEIFHPSRDGAGALYTVEHYQQIRNKLSPDGLVCQWLPLFQLDIPTFQSILRSFLAVFPDSQLHLGHFSLQQPILCLVGRKSPTRLDPNWLATKVTYAPLQQQLVQSRLNSDLALLGGFLASGEELQQLAGNGPLNTDNHPYVTYQAPQFVYQAPEPAAKRLLTLLAMLEKTDAEQLTQDPVLANNLHNYWQARDLFLQAGVNVRQDDNIMQILVKTYPQLISAVQTSQDFEPAYRALIGLANQVYGINRDVALNLLDELDAAAPRINDARRLRSQLN